MTAKTLNHAKTFRGVRAGHYRYRPAVSLLLAHYLTDVGEVGIEMQISLYSLACALVQEGTDVEFLADLTARIYAAREAQYAKETRR